MSDHDILFIPGPVEVDAELREIMAMPLMGHRQPAFLEEVKAVCEKLKPFFLTKAYTLFENCPATALMDAAVRNLIGERILHCVGGAFAERWFKVSSACGRKPEALSVPWGEVVTPDVLRETLTSSPPFEAVAITYSETSTGARAPLKELAAVVREVAPDTLILVDAVSAVGGIELRFDEWGIDLAFAGTQKCLALPPGLCVYALSERAMEKAKTVPDRGFLWDFERAAKGLAAGKASATPNVPLVFALSHQLDRIAAEGIENRWQRHRDMLGAVTAWAGDHEYEFLVDEAYRSPTVSAIRNSGRVVKDLIAKAKGGGFVLGNGYGKLKGETFRIGHMGDHTVARLQRLLSLLD
jgi:aspartate aminotransferase-like enzyme